jgi:hypothetical protein
LAYSSILKTDFSETSVDFNGSQQIELLMNTSVRTSNAAYQLVVYLKALPVNENYIISKTGHNE